MALDKKYIRTGKKLAEEISETDFYKIRTIIKNIKDKLFVDTVSRAAINKITGVVYRLKKPVRTKKEKLDKQKIDNGS